MQIKSQLAKGSFAQKRNEETEKNRMKAYSERMTALLKKKEDGGKN